MKVSYRGRDYSVMGGASESDSEAGMSRVICRGVTEHRAGV